MSDVSVFLVEECGAVTVDWVVLTAAIAGLSFATMGLLGNALGHQSNAMGDVLGNGEIVYGARNFGATPLEMAQAVDLTFYGANWPGQRLSALEEMTDQQLRNQHRRWTSIASDPDHANNARAADQLAVLQIAMDVRRVQP